MYRGEVGACPPPLCGDGLGTQGPDRTRTREGLIGILGAGSDSGGPHGPRGGRDRNPHGRIGMGGLDPPSGAFPCSRDPAVEVEAWSHLRVEEVYLDGWVKKKRWHSHAPGTRLLKLKLGRTFGWRKFASTVGSKKKGHHTYILPPCPPPYVGGLWTGWSRRPFSVASPPGPSVPEPLGSRVLTNSMDSTR